MIFFMFYYKKNITKNRLIIKNGIKLDIDNNNSRKYKVEIMCNSTIYIKKVKSGQLLRLYYLIT